MPAPLPFPTINWHKLVSLFNSPGLRGSGWKRPSVTPYVTGFVGRACTVVAQARKPGAKFVLVINGLAALQVDPVNGPALVPPGLAVPLGMVARSFTMMEFGTDRVRLRGSKSVLAERCTSALGVTRQEQHAISCSSGVNAYTFTQILPVVPARGPEASAPRAPAFVILITPSPTLRLAR